MIIRGIKGKRGLSEIVAYVLLISIAIALSVLVFNWLKFYVSSDSSEQCPDDLAIIIKDYSCNNKILTLTIQNKGLFSIDGFVLRINNRTNAEIGLYTLNNTGTKILPGNESTKDYDFSSYSKITLIDIQPFIANPSRKYCKNIVSQKVNC